MINNHLNDKKNLKKLIVNKKAHKHKIIQDAKKKLQKQYIRII